MLNLSQKNPLWKDAKIGKSSSNLAGNGCLITALCDIWSKFHYDTENRDYLRPDKAAKTWTFTAVADDPDPRYLLWSSISQSGLKFIWRSWVWTPNDLTPDPVTGEKGLMGDIVNKYARHPDYGVVLRVQTKFGQHWLACTGRSVFGWSANDPMGGIRRWALPYPYKYIDGFALIAKN